MPSELSIDCLIKNNNSPQLLNLMLNPDVGQHPATIPEEGDSGLDTEQSMPQDLSGIVLPQDATVQNAKALTIIQTASQLQTLLQSLTQPTHNEQQPQPVIQQQPTVTVNQPLVTTGQPVAMQRSSNINVMPRNATQGADLRPCLWSDTDLQQLSGKPRSLMSSSEIRRASTGSVVSMAGSPIKRNGHFLVPQVLQHDILLLLQFAYPLQDVTPQIVL